MEDSKRLSHDNELDKSINKEISKDNKKEELISNSINESNKIIDSKIIQTENSIDKRNNKVDKEELIEDNKKAEVTQNLSSNKNNIIEKSNNEIIKEKTFEDNKLSIKEVNLDTTTNKSLESIDKSIKEVGKEKIKEENKSVILTDKSNTNVDKKNNDPKEISSSKPIKPKTKPVKEPPIEKKPFLEFVNEYLIPEIKNEFKLKGKQVNKINLQKTHRPIAEDICWVIYCEINNTCNFWLSFEKDDITSLKSFSLCKNYEKPSIIESFLIDEKKITLKLIISRILQRLNGQKLIGAN